MSESESVSVSVCLPAPSSKAYTVCGRYSPHEGRRHLEYTTQDGFDTDTQKAEVKQSPVKSLRTSRLIQPGTCHSKAVDMLMTGHDCT